MGVKITQCSFKCLVLNCLFLSQRNNEARQLYYAELKGRVLRSECFEQEGLYFQLAAYALQADLGDYEEPNFAYFSPQSFFPFWVRVFQFPGLNLWS